LRLLFDENLSSRLVGALADQFPNSSHVNLVDLASATDLDIWGKIRTFEISPEESLLVLS
jgi:predicted nuclease of predicted toxin-antitoxin system